MSRTRTTFSKETVELVTRLWNAGDKRSLKYVSTAGISRNTLDYHRERQEPFSIYGNGTQGVNNSARRSQSLMTKQQQVLFGMKQHEC